MQSADRALAVLELLGTRSTAGVTEIADALGVHKSTASRLVSVLESRGFVEQLRERGRYRLGYTIVRLAGATLARRDLVREAQEACEDLAEQVGETVNVAILMDGRAVNVHEARGTSGVALQTWVGQSTPLHATSTGKALLSGLDPVDARLTVGPTLERFTERTVTDIELLAAELAEVRRRGWAAAVEELETGLNAISAPVRDETAGVVASLSSSGPAYRLHPGRVDEVAPLVMAAAAEVSRRLGYQP